MPGYDEALDVKDCPWGDPNEPPDLAKARQMLKDAGVDGTKVTVWGNNDDPTDKVTEAYADQLNKMGFKATPRIIDGGIYFQTIGNAKTAPQTGFANWFADFPHPKNFMFLVDGKSIQPTNNQNYGNVDDPEITAGIARLNKLPIDDKTTEEWKTAERRRGRGAAGSLPTDTASWRRSCRSGWTSTTATSSIPSTTTTTRASASSSPGVTLTGRAFRRPPGEVGLAWRS